MVRLPCGIWIKGNLQINSLCSLKRFFIIMNFILNGFLRNIFRIQVARYLGAIGGAETVRQGAVGVITERSRVRIVLRVTPTLVTSVKTVGVSVAEQLCRETRTGKISVLNLTIWEKFCWEGGLYCLSENI